MTRQSIPFSPSPLRTPTRSVCRFGFVQVGFGPLMGIPATGRKVKIRGMRSSWRISLSGFATAYGFLVASRKLVFRDLVRFF
jgi:hypothetical protein